MKEFPVNKLDYYETFPAYLQGISKKYGDRPAISYFNRDKLEVVHTYREFSSQVFSVAETLCSLGLAEKHIAIVGENSYDWLVAYFAVAVSGGVAVCIDVEQADEGIRQMIQQSDCQAVFASGTNLSICEVLLHSENGITNLFAIGEEASGEEYHTIDSMIRKGTESLKAGESLQAKLTIEPGQAASIVYTSGTTSLSKPVMLSHKAILYNASDALYNVTLGDTTFTALPFYHSYGMTGAVLDSLVWGSHFYLNGNLKTMMRDLHLAKPNTMMSVPLIVESIYKQMWLSAEREGKADQLHKLMKACRTLKKLHLPWQNKTLESIKQKMVGDLKIIICGGAHLEKEICEDFELFGVQVLQGYGISECSPIVSTNGNFRYKLGSVGPVLPNYEVKTVEEEIYVKGISLMNGYYNQPEETKAAFEDGWFKTGDLGYLDKDGFLYITGRKKNLVVFKNGKKTSPEKLEEKIQKIPLVKEVMVYGAASGASADDVKLSASIYPDPEYAKGLSSYEILENLQKEIDKINCDLPTYQQIQMVHIREKEFVKTGTKKIKRNLT